MLSACASDPSVRVVTETKTVEVPVEVYKPLPAALVRPTPYPPGLGEEFTVEDMIDLVFDLYDTVDQANADKGRAGQLTQPPPSADIPQ